MPVAIYQKILNECIHEDQSHARRFKNVVRVTAKVQHWQPGTKATEVEARMATYVYASTNHQQLAAHSWYKYGQ